MNPYLSQLTNINNEKWWELKFFLCNQCINIVYPNEENVFMCPIMKKMRLLCESMFIPTERRTLVPKMVKKRSFSYETKASVSFIPMRRMCSWYPIMKRNDIIMWICVCPNRQVNINSKISRKWCFSYETKASISFMVPKLTDEY